jgi:hypothetical protein
VSNTQLNDAPAAPTGHCVCGLPTRAPHQSGHGLWWWPTEDPPPGLLVHAVAWLGDDEPAERCWRRRPNGIDWQLVGSQVTLRRLSGWSGVGTCDQGNQHPVIRVDEL